MTSFTNRIHYIFFAAGFVIVSLGAGLAVAGAADTDAALIADSGSASINPDFGADPSSLSVPGGGGAGSLPYTGTDALPMLLAGAVLILLGLGLRRFSSSRSTA